MARRAGVAPATAYTYFASKEHLVTEVFWQRVRELDRPGPQQVRVLFHSYHPRRTVLSSRGFETGESRLLRPRFFIYGVLILAMGALFFLRASKRESLHVTVMRSQGMPYTIEEGMIRNLYTLHLQNKSDEARTFLVSAGDGTEALGPAA